MSETEGNPLAKFIDFHFHALRWYEYLVYVSGSLICIAFAGLMSGLNLGLLSFDTMTLEILSQTGTKKEKKRAKKILRLVKHHHWLLVTLLFANAIALEALPIFLDELVPSTVAILISVTCVLFFGEVVPQALCTRYALVIGSYSFYLVFAIMIITFPVSFPVAKLLDCIIGKNHMTYFRRAQLKELVALHGHETDPKMRKGHHQHGPLNHDEITVIRGALEMSTKTVSSIMTSLENVYALPLNTSLGYSVMKEIQEKGHSRIPVYANGDKENILGLLLVKNLITLSPEDEVELSSLKFRKIPAVEEDMNIGEMLNYFQEGKSHMCVVISSLREEQEEGVPSSDAKYFDDLKSLILFDEKYNEDGDHKKEEEEEKEEKEKEKEEKEDKNKKKDGEGEEIVKIKEEKKVLENLPENRKILGIVTLEDVIEELIQEEIIDETDIYVDLNTHLRVADMYRRISISAAARNRAGIGGNRTSIKSGISSNNNAAFSGGKKSSNFSNYDIERILEERERQVRGSRREMQEMMRMKEKEIKIFQNPIMEQKEEEEEEEEEE